MRVFSVFHKTAQNRPKNIQNEQNEQNTLCAIQRNTVLCVFLSLRKCLTKNIRKTRPTHCKTSAKHTAKHRKTLLFEQHSQNTAKHPQNTRTTPQNIAKHHKTDLLTKQTELANKLLRSRTKLGRPRLGARRGGFFGRERATGTGWRRVSSEDAPASSEARLWLDAARPWRLLYFAFRRRQHNTPIWAARRALIALAHGQPHRGERWCLREGPRRAQHGLRGCRAQCGESEVHRL